MTERPAKRSARACSHARCASGASGRWPWPWRGAGGFLAGVLLIAILGGAQPVYKERTLTVARPLQGSAVPALVGQRLDVALDRLQSASA